MCATGGHRYGGPGGWRACACERQIPGHLDSPPDPAGGPGCGMVWRVCADCPHVDEHHVTDDGQYRPTGWPVVVTLCGSMRFAGLMSRVAAEETARGVIVLAPFVVVVEHDQDGPLKVMLDELHRRKIEASDRVIVVSDATGYVGESTRAEIKHAARVGVPVTYRRVTAPPVQPDEDGLDLLADVADIMDGAGVDRVRPLDLLTALIERDRASYGRWTVTDLLDALPHGAQPRTIGGTLQVLLSGVREALAEHGPIVVRSA